MKEYASNQPLIYGGVFKTWYGLCEHPTAALTATLQVSDEGEYEVNRSSARV